MVFRVPHPSPAAPPYGSRDAARPDGGRPRFRAGLPSLASLLTWGAAALLVAAIVHLSSILLMPRLAGRDAYSRLAAYAPSSGFHLLPAPRPGASVTPFADPGTPVAVCRYDLAGGVWRLRGAVEEENMMTLTFYARPGVVFHTVGERAALGGRIDVTLGTATQIEAIEAADAEGVAPRDVRLIAPGVTGFVLVRAMPASPFDLDALRKRMEGIECAPGQ